MEVGTLNFQDAIRESYDDSTKSLKTNIVSGTITASSQVTVTLNNTPTINAVVNVGAATDPKIFIGLTTAVISNATLYAVVNTSAPGVGNSIVTIANLPLTTQIVGNVTIDSQPAWADPKTYIGLVTVTQASSVRSVAGNLTLTDSKGFIGLTTTVNGQAWPDPKGYIGLVTITGSLSAPAGNVTLDAGSRTGILGNLTLSDSKGFIGLVTIGGGTLGTTFAGNVTLDPGSKTGIVGNVTLTDSKNYIGLVTATLGNGNPSVSSFGQFFPVLQSIASGGLGPVALDNFGRQQVKITADGNTFMGLATTVNGVGDRFIGLVTAWVSGIAGNLTITDSKGFIGLTTSVNGTAWPDPKTYIGLVTVGHTVTVGAHGITGNLTLSDSKAGIGLVSVFGGSLGIIGNLTLSDSKGFIGLVTVDIDHAWPDPKTFLGLATTVNGAGTQFIGLVTAWTRNAGSAKTITPYALAMSTSSVVTIAVPTNNAAMYITNMVLSSDATVRVSIKSGVTYMTGNASIGIVLNPGGGFIQTGAPDSPSWIGLPSGALVVEKFDMTGTKANIGGTLVTFTE